MAGLDPPTNLTVSPIRLSLFYQIQVPKPWTAESEARRICEALEQIPFAEQKGLDGVWFFEHHFRPCGHTIARAGPDIGGHPTRVDRKFGRRPDRRGSLHLPTLSRSDRIRGARMGGSQP
jgi:hypothetical protein